MSTRVTTRERQVAELIGFGYTEKEIGSRLQITVDTVKSHKKSLFCKTHSRNIADVTRWVFQEQTGKKPIPKSC